jgi:hypothetical protein
VGVTVKRIDSAAFAKWAKARLPAPAAHMTDAKRHAFAALVDSARARGPAAPVEYRSEYPKYEFLTYLVAELGFLLHGSRHPDITLFEPRPAHDLYEFSAQHAVYAASDGIWPIVFAIRDRRPQQGTFFNGCSRLVFDDVSRSEPYYHFALTAEGLREQPWTTGTIYVLPRKTFVPHPLIHEQGLTLTHEEWASPEAVVPIAKIAVSPEDFPFLHDFWGYNPDRLAGPHVWSELDHENRELFPIRPRSRA